MRVVVRVVLGDSTTRAARRMPLVLATICCLPQGIAGSGPCMASLKADRRTRVPQGGTPVMSHGNRGRPGRRHPFANVLVFSSPFCAGLSVPLAPPPGVQREAGWSTSEPWPRGMIPVRLLSDTGCIYKISIVRRDYSTRVWQDPDPRRMFIYLFIYWGRGGRGTGDNGDRADPPVELLGCDESRCPARC